MPYKPSTNRLASVDFGRADSALPEQIGPFKIHGVLGRGGMGVVFDASAESGERLALKLIRPIGDGDRVRQLVARFLREAEILEKFNHPSIVRLVASGDVDSLMYLAMERINGVSLLAVRRKGPLSFDAVISLGAQLSDALAHMHDHGVVHRDIKPANVLIDKSGRPVITDFGISGSTDAVAITRHGDLLGSPGFMAPEVTHGDAPGALSDQFALGRMLFELGAVGDAGRLPKNLPLLEMLEASLRIDWSRLPAGWAAVESILRRMTADAPAERFPSSHAARDAFKALMGHPLDDFNTLNGHVSRLNLKSDHAWAEMSTTSMDAVDPRKAGVDGLALVGAGADFDPRILSGLEVPDARPRSAVPSPSTPPEPDAESSTPTRPAIEALNDGLHDGLKEDEPPTPRSLDAPPEVFARPPSRAGGPAFTRPPSQSGAPRAPSWDAEANPVAPASRGGSVPPPQARRAQSQEDVLEALADIARPATNAVKAPVAPMPVAPTPDKPRARATADPELPSRPPSSSQRSRAMSHSHARPKSASDEGRIATLERQVTGLREQVSNARMQPRRRSPMGALIAGIVGLGVGAGAGAGLMNRPLPAPTPIIVPAHWDEVAAPDLGPRTPTKQSIDEARFMLETAERHLTKRETGEATQLLKLCIDTADLPECHKRLASIYALFHDPKARMHLEHFLRVAPASPDAEAIRQALEAQAPKRSK